eukprot:g8966.t1
MGIFKKFSPGLGHDGDGLYGTLTNNSLRCLVENLGVEGKTLIDIGAADGKVMLAGLALGAKSVYGVELAGSSLEVKFDAMVRKLREGYLRPAQKAALKCNTDIVKLKLGTISEILLHQFPSMHRITPGRNVVVSAVWHGFNIEAKEALLTILSRSQHVARFTLVGPVKKDYGVSEDVLAFVKQSNPKCRIKKISNESATLSGGGEKYRALTFELL